MSLSKQLTLFIGLMALGTTSAWAACTRLSQPTVNLDMVVGRVVVPPDLPVGSVIVSGTGRCRAGRGQLQLHRHQPLCGEDRLYRFDRSGQ
jgi:hypothetical protein